MEVILHEKGKFANNLGRALDRHVFCGKLNNRLVI
jgi:hypothetical protein